jgi:hypothetical protein
MRGLKDIAEDLDLLVARDFDLGNTSAAGWERLQRLCDELLAINDVASCAPVMFKIMERLDGSDLGNPGPLVHTLEEWRGTYESFLAESIRRKPTPLSVWMVNRILNSKPSDATNWLVLLQQVLDHPGAASKAKQQAAHFLKYQAGLNYPRARKTS